MIERLRRAKIPDRPPLELRGHAAILISKLLQRKVTVFWGEKRFITGTVERYNPPDNLSVTLASCRRYEPCVHGSLGLDVYDVESISVGIDRVELKI